MKVRGRPVGAALSRAAVACLVLDAAIHVSHHVCDPLLWTCKGDPSRAAVVERLSHTPGKHLVIVRYPEGYNVHDDWVFNGADIDSAKLLWAREINPQQNQKLFDYFSDRRIWLIEPEKDNTEFIPYPLSATPPKQ
jgi:hypothetical protein